MIIHNSDLTILKGVDLTPDYEYTIDFDTPLEQSSYFNTKVVATLSDSNYSHLNPTEYVTVPYAYEDVEDVNYCIISNGAELDKYCFITQVEYVSENTTRLYLKLDVMQTFMFKYELGECFVEREHQDRFIKKKLNGVSEWLSPIYNVEDEGLAYGDEYIKKIDLTHAYQLSDDEYILFEYLWRKVKGTDRHPYLTKINNIELGYGVIIYPIIYSKTRYPKYRGNYSLNFEPWGGKPFLLTPFGAPRQNERYMQAIISSIPPSSWSMKVDDEAKSITFQLVGYDSSNIYAPFVEEDSNLGNGIFVNSVYEDPENFPTIQNVIAPYSGLNDNLLPFYTEKSTRSMVREPKMRTYPYNFTKINYLGKEIIIKNEYIGENNSLLAKSGAVGIRAYQSMTLEASTSLEAVNYLTEIDQSTENDVNHNNVVTVQTPSYLALETSAWDQYLQQNRAQRTSGYVNAAVTTAAGAGLAIAGTVLSGGAAGFAAIGAAQSVIAGLTGVSSQIAKEHDIRNQPLDVKQFSGDLAITNMLSSFGATIEEYKITETYQKRLYNYFYHYGYKALDFKTPDTKSRYYFNYLKCTDVNIKTDIPSIYIDQIKDIYKKGITFWHYRRGQWKGVNNYEYENAEMSLIGG